MCDKNEVCYFNTQTIEDFRCKCSETGKLICSTQARLQSIIKSSKEREDGLYVHLESAMETDDDIHTSIYYHSSCVSSYTSKEHIKRRKRKLSFVCVSHNSYDSPPKKLLRRSDVGIFDFKKDCVFCGEECNCDPPIRNPKRWRKAYVCRTADRGKDQKTFKEAILNVCSQRGDAQAKEVQLRLEGAVSDLHAAEARYHEDCRIKFMAPGSVKNEMKKQMTRDEHKDLALENVIHAMSSDEERPWTSSEAYRYYKGENGEILSRSTLVNALSKYFGSRLLVLYSKGLSSILIFRSKASQLVRIEEDDDEDVSIARIAKMIALESKQLGVDKTKYTTNIDKAIASQPISYTLMTLLSCISEHLDNTLPAILIGNIITSIIANCNTPLQIALGVFMRETTIVDKAYDYRITCSYGEVVRFKESAAREASKNRTKQMFVIHGDLIQAVADNYDANISSQNGLIQTHALAMLLTQNNNNHDVTSQEHTIPRIKKEDMRADAIEDTPVHFFHGPKKPPMPNAEAGRNVLSLKVMAMQQVSLNRARNLDYLFFKQMTKEN